MQDRFAESHRDGTILDASVLMDLFTGLGGPVAHADELGLQGGMGERDTLFLHRIRSWSVEAGETSNEVRVATEVRIRETCAGGAVRRVRVKVRRSDGHG